MEEEETKDVLGPSGGQEDTNQEDMSYSAQLRRSLLNAMSNMPARTHDCRVDGRGVRNRDHTPDRENLEGYLLGALQAATGTTVFTGLDMAIAEAEEERWAERVRGERPGITSTIPEALRRVDGELCYERSRQHQHDIDNSRTEHEYRAEMLAIGRASQLDIYNRLQAQDRERRDQETMTVTSMDGTRYVVDRAVARPTTMGGLDLARTEARALARISEYSADELGRVERVGPSQEELYHPVRFISAAMAENIANQIDREVLQSSEVATTGRKLSAEPEMQSISITTFSSRRVVIRRKKDGD